MTPEEIQIKHLNDALQGIVDADIIIDNYMLGPLGKDPDGHLARVSPIVKEARERLTDRIKRIAAENGIDPARPDLNPDES